MKRAIMSLGLAVVMAVAGSLAFDVFGGTEQQAAIAAKPGQKTCKAKTNSGKTKTWTCSTNQTCCVNRAFDLYVCGYPGLGCL